MRSYFKSVAGTCVVLAIVFSATLYTACNKKDTGSYTSLCKGITCQNNGTCIDGKCTCPTGYEGGMCEEKSNKRYLGKWQMTQKTTWSNDNKLIGKTSTYVVTVTESPSGPATLIVDDFMNNTAYDGIEWVLGRRYETVVTERQVVIKDSVHIIRDTVETDVQDDPTNFIFKKYQAVKNSGYIIVEGDGFVDGIGTIMQGSFGITYGDSAKGVINENIEFTAYYIQ